jgi:hypothetical protein
VAREEHLQAFLEQAGRSRILEQRPEALDRLRGRCLDLEAELCRQPHRTQHPHRVFAVAGFRVADQAQQAVLDILEPAHVIAHREVLDRVIQRVRGEVAAHRVLFDRSVDVVAQQAAALVRLPIAAAVVAVGAERGDLDDLAAEHDVRESEAAADQAAVAELLAHLLGRRIGGDVEVLGMAADEDVAHRAADEECAEAGFAQPVQHTQRVRADLAARDVVRFARDDARLDGLGRGVGIWMHRSGVAAVS